MQNKKIILVSILILGALALGIFLSFSKLSPLIQTNVFSDVTNEHKNGEAIAYVRENNIVQGYPDGTFKPANKINRAELTKIIVEAAYPGQAQGENCFPDVKNEWYAKYVCFAKEKGLVAGYPDGTFGPGNDIAFVEAAKIIASGLSITVEAPAENEPWYQPYVFELGERGAIPLSILKFSKKITRGEMAEMIYRLKANTTNQDSIDYEAIAGLEAVKSQLQFVPSSMQKYVEQQMERDFITGYMAKKQTYQNQDVEHGSAPQTDPENGSENNNATEDHSNTAAAEQNGQSIFTGKQCTKKTEPVVFSHYIINPEDINEFSPAGTPSWGKIRLEPFIELKQKTAIYAPADMDLVYGLYYYDNPEKTKTSYTLFFQIGCDIALKFNGLETVTTGIAQTLRQTPKETSIRENSDLLATPLQIKAGDIIGYTEENNTTRFSWMLLDATKQNSYVNQKRYKQQKEKFHAVFCPFDIFTPEIKKEYMAKTALGATGTCAQTTQDIAGTISGTWYDKKFEDDPYSQGQLSAGLYTDGTVLVTRHTVQYQYGEEIHVKSDQTTYKKPAEITGTHCYKNGYGSGIAFLKMVSETEMKAFVDFSTTECPQTFPEDKSTTYYR